MDQTTYQFVDARSQIFNNSDYSVSHNFDKGFLSVTLIQSEEQVKINWKPFTLSDILTSMGGTTTGLFGIFYVLIAGYQSFSYDTASINRLFLQKSATAEGLERTEEPLPATTTEPKWNGTSTATMNSA